ncbi:MAG: histidine kinase [Corynebacterium sp.]|uniref:sensor histidine kinase n=1 Tax=Corynebacterium sp. TaxID=1720 RepID=UPI0026E05F9C|nr:histidine kinase [Corynebacterium sp.]MDO5670609.1 histidine kinase [Corynebacterium sp.]
MDITQLRHKPGKAAGLWFGVALLGALAQLLMVPVIYGWQDLELLPEQEGIARTGYLLWWLFSGSVALFAFAWTLLRGRAGRLSVVDGVVVFFGVVGPLGLPAAVYTLALVSSWLRWHPALIVYGVAAGAVLVDARLQSVSAPDTDSFVGLAILPTVALFGVWWGRRREAKERFVERLRTAELEARTVRSEERARIARDLHDSLSHRLSLISLHAGALSYRADLGGQQVTEASGLLQQQAEAATADLREVLHVLRDSSAAVDPAMSVADLVDSARRAGTEVLIDEASLRLVTSPQGQSTLAAHAVHRTLQEVLTNARKHAPGQPVTVTLWHEEGTLSMRASNPCPHAATGRGHGLLGLKERAELAGGELRVTPGDPFTVTLEVPWT